MTRSSSLLLRYILGNPHSVDADAAQCTTYLRFDPDEALLIRIALSKGFEYPVCPRCGTVLRQESGRNPAREDRVAAFLCTCCHRAVIIRLSAGEAVPPAP
ncbi:MAG: hypothetical protein ACT4PM_04490 [Gemmatimonadales bacterium]